MRTAHRCSPCTVAVFLALCTILPVSGCAELTAGHLQRKTLEAGVVEHIAGKFLRFDYETMPLGNGFGVVGSAWPNKDNLPPWADMVQNLSITAYLCDEKGVVLAQDPKNFPARTLAPGGIPFNFTLSPKASPIGELFISFGYRGTFTASKPSAGGQGLDNGAGQHSFFASEGAVLKN